MADEAETPKTTVYDVLRHLIDAVFRVGGITDVTHTTLHGAVDDADPAAAEARRKAETELSPAEQAELERLLNKQQETAARAPARAPAPAAPAAPAAPVVAVPPYPGPVNPPPASGNGGDAPASPFAGQ